ncbi:hypothetical protein KP509_19G015400 [Ceratopteris richardii]|uniref:Uncharacterized protein n=1 Tax=Ceratopteris richardii TaxID=49495 RepID=A0A8T2SM77_CERRI|nr:hypothetical protein KP509_19G015400 [Ceratopteris richardii]
MENCPFLLKCCLRMILIRLKKTTIHIEFKENCHLNTNPKVNNLDNHQCLGVNHFTIGSEGEGWTLVRSRKQKKPTIGTYSTCTSNTLLNANLNKNLNLEDSIFTLELEVYD